MTTKLSENAEIVVKDRYYLRKPDGEFLEHNWHDMSLRIGHALGLGEYQKVSNVAWMRKNGEPLIGNVEELGVGRGRAAADAFQKFTKDFVEMLSERRGIPGTPTLMNAGSPYVKWAMSSCFIIPLGNSIAQIFEAVKNVAVIGKHGGGSGMSGALLSPYGTKTNNGGIASGVVSFMEPFQAANNSVKSGGRRRIAMMMELPTWHPEILMFLDCKSKTGPGMEKVLIESHGMTEEAADQTLEMLGWLRRETVALGDGSYVRKHWNAPFHGFNISVTEDDEFRDAVKNNKLYMLKRALIPEGEDELAPTRLDFEPWKGPVIDPRGEEGMVVTDRQGIKWIDARKLDDRIARAAWETGEPGKQYLDVINRDNPVKNRGLILNSNPCGEFDLVFNSSCNLGSLVLSKYYKPFIGIGKPRNDAYEAQIHWSRCIDWDLLAKDSRTMTRALDHVITLNEYPTADIDRVSKAIRPVGMGHMGLADLLLLLGIRYGSSLSLEVTAAVLQWQQYHAWLESTQLAKEFGEFEDLKLNQPYFDAKMKWLTVDIFKHPAYDRSQVDDLQVAYKSNGVRNCQVTTVAPCGTISQPAEANGGCEPYFTFGDMVRQDGVGVREYTNPHVARYFKEHPTAKKLPDYFVDANQVTPTEHIQMLATVQKYTDNAVSKTVNLPHDATVEDVKLCYQLAYDLGCKGVAVYRDNCREGVLLRKENMKGANQPSKSPVAEKASPAVSRGDGILLLPESLPARRYKIPDGRGGKLFVILTAHPKTGDLVEVFLKGDGVNEWLDLTARLMSLCLRAGLPVSELRQQLKRSAGDKTIYFHSNQYTSVSQVLDNVLFECAAPYFRSIAGEEDDPEEIAILAPPSVEVHVRTGELCPKCGANMKPSSGCWDCPACFYSKCGGA